MYVIYDKTNYKCQCRPGSTMVYRDLPEDFPAPVTGEITLCADDGFVLRTDNPADYFRQTFSDGVLTLTNNPEPEIVEVNVDQFRTETIRRISSECNSAIVAGVDVPLSDGSTGHFALEETDQINLTTAYNAVQQGAVGYPYHADGQLCKMFPAADIIAISEAATAHKLYHLTYCNHMMEWARRAETVDELNGIVYGAELPTDLAANMQEILTNAAAV